MHPHSQDHPAAQSPSHYVCPRVVWPTLHCFLCWRPWRWSGPRVRRCRCWASTQQKPALQGGRGQKKGAAGLVDHLALPGSCNQSPVFLRDVPGAEKGPTRVCLQRQGVGLLGFSNVPHPAPLLLAFRSSPRATAWLGLWTFFPMDPE